MTETETTETSKLRSGWCAADEGDELLVSFMRLGRAIKRIHHLELEPPQSFVMHMLVANGASRLSDLAASVRLDVSTTSRHIRGLEQLGYVERTSDPADGRASLLTATDAGREVLQRQFGESRRRIAAIMHGWSTDDIDSLRRLLARLTNDIEHDQIENPTR